MFAKVTAGNARGARRANERIERDSAGRYKIQTCTLGQFAALLKDGLAINANIVKSANIKFEN